MEPQTPPRMLDDSSFFSSSSVPTTPMTPLDGDVVAATQQDDLVLFVETVQFDPRRIRQQLLKSIADLSSRGLYNSMKWAAEQADGIETQDGDDDEEDGDDSPTDDESLKLSEDEMLKERRERTRLARAESYFQLKEFLRASDVLQKGCGGLGLDEDPSALSCRALFVATYSRFLAGERRKQEESIETPQFPG